MSALRPGIPSPELTASLPLEFLGLGSLGGLAGRGVGAPPLSLGSPWADSSHLAGIVWSDVFGASVPRPVTRAEAMAVPAYARARHVICHTVGRITVRSYRIGSAEPLTGPAAPAWVERTDGAVPWFHLKTWTADDLLWYGWSCWRRNNGANPNGFPLSVSRQPMGTWSLEDGGTGRVLIDRGDGVHELVDQRTICLIPGPHEGLLAFGQDAIRHASDLQRAAGRAAKHPAAHIVLQQTSGTPLPQDSADEKVWTVRKLIRMWAQSRDGIDGGVAFLPENLKATEMGTFDRHLLVDGRNAAAVDAARHASLPADLLDASTETSMTYSNSRDNDRRALDYGVGAYMGAMSARWSQDDMTPHGTRNAFDTEEWLDQTVPGQAPSETPPPAQPARPTIVPVRESA
jgi:hypothetical protein